MPGGDQDVRLTAAGSSPPLLGCLAQKGGWEKAEGNRGETGGRHGSRDHRFDDPTTYIVVRVSALICPSVDGWRRLETGEEMRSRISSAGPLPRVAFGSSGPSAIVQDGGTCVAVYILCDTVRVLLLLTISGTRISCLDWGRHVVNGTQTNWSVPGLGCGK